MSAHFLVALTSNHATDARSPHLELLGVPEAAPERLHLRDVAAQASVDAAAVVADEDAAVDGRP